MSLEYNQSLDDLKKINKLCKRIALITEEEIDSAIRLAESQAYYSHPLKMAKAAKIQSIGQHNLKVLTSFKSLKNDIQELIKNT